MRHRVQLRNELAVGRALLVTIVAGVPICSHAEGISGLEEVVVTAQKREERLQDVPISITAMSGAELEAKGIANMYGALSATPSVTVEKLSASTNTVAVFMRGLGNVGVNANSGGSVGFYQDGFFVPRMYGVTSELADVERIEVLRGPQGTLYGMNTIGGAVNIVSKRPSGEFGLKQRLDFGSRDEFRSSTAINLPKWNGIAAKVSALNSSIDGYVRNAGPSNDFGEEGSRAGRLQLRIEPTDKLSIDYFVDVGRYDWTSLYYQAPDMHGTTPPLLGSVYVGPDRPLSTSYRAFDVPKNQDKLQAHGLTLTWDASEALTVKSLTGYRDLTSENDINFVDSPGFPFMQAEDSGSRQFSQEMQFLGTLLAGQLRYVAGLYYFEQKISGHLDYDFSALGAGHQIKQSKYQAESRAGYGQLTWAPGRLELTLGARYTEDDRAGQAHDSGAFIPVDVRHDVDTSFSSFNPAFIVNYKWTDDLRTYTKVTTGYKAGGVFFTTPGFPNTFDPEEVTTYEIGLKSDWFDKRLRLNADVFWNDYRDFQQAIPAGSPIEGVNFLTYAAYNLGKVAIKGLEVDATLAPTDDLMLSVSYSYLDPEIQEVPVIANTLYDNAVNSLSPYRAGDNIAHLYTVPFASKNSVSIAGDLTFARFGSSELTAHLDYRWQSRYYFYPVLGPAVANRDKGSVPSYGRLNARLSWTATFDSGSRAMLSLWGRNLTDNRSPQGVTPAMADTNGLPTPEPTSVTSANIVFLPPRSYGVSLGYEF